MKIAVTGGSGGIGSAIIKEALAQGHSAVSIDRVAASPERAHAGVPFVALNTDDYDALLAAMRGCDALIHMAAIPSPGNHPDHVVHNNNVVGSYNALRAAAELGIRRVCQASSVNALGMSYSRRAHYDYFPLDEGHATYNEDPYSLSKWICEAQGDSICRRYEEMSVASMRFHWVVRDRAFANTAHDGNASDPLIVTNIWAYTRFDAAARACLLALTPNFRGHEAFYITAPDTMVDVPSLDLAREFYPQVPVRGDLSGQRSFIDCRKAERLLGWQHPAG